MEIKEIGFIFENLEYISLHKKDIGAFCIDNIYECVSRTACNSIGKRKCSDYIHIQINNVIKEVDRIEKYKDITGIDLFYENGEKETIYVPYSTDNGNYWENNNYQSSFMSKNGYLHIVISNSKTAKEVFKDEFENDDNLGFYFDMYSL